MSESQRILIILDNFEVAHLDQLQALSQIDITILLISRERMPDAMFPTIRIGEMDDAELAQMFEHFSHCALSDQEKWKYFETIITTIERHTLLTELIARQIDKSYLDLETAETMVAGIGLSELPTEKIDYVHDQTAYHGTLLKILDKLVEIDHFSEQDKCCMKLLSFFNAPGIEGGLFKYLTDSPNLDLVNDLETAGWLKREDSLLYLHPMMQEYIRSWPWIPVTEHAADQLMMRMYSMLLPAGKRDDTSRQFPENPDEFYGMLRLADQVIVNCDRATEASQKLLYRWLMDAPVDQDTLALFRMLDLLKNPEYLDDSSILRLYETAAYEYLTP